VEPDKPVVMVSLQGAQAYCRWLSEKTGQLHRLPTEIEWEKAARGPCSYVYSYGNVYSQSMSNQATGTLQPVGSYPANAFGLFDMTGNVFEWMSNRYDTEASEQVMNHALRGGSFVLDGMYLRNSFRMRQCPSVMTDDIGFRVVRDSAD
jgi:formylglycine-generating enzyme required for sulfatase activity